MRDEPPAATMMVARHPIHATLAAFPLVCFIGALLTDITYARSYEMQWANFSIWLISAGLVTGVIAALAGIIDVVANRRARAQRAGWPHALGTGLALILALFNAFVHSRDAYTSVVPTGLILSVLVVLILLVTTWLGGSNIYNRAGVAK